jgi:hypothetical protein
MSEELQEQQLVPIEEQISQELVKQNVTEIVIAGLKEKYGHLKISGIEDRETYDLVKSGRKEVKSFRVLAKKICEKGREKAVAEQKAWVAKQKEVTDKLAEIEDPLEEQEKAFDAAVTKAKEEKKRKQEEQLITRQQTLSAMGALYSDGNFKLGEVSFEMSLVKECEPDIWEDSILPKFKEEYEKVEADRIEHDQAKREQEAEFMRKQLEQEKKQKELEEKEAAIKKAQEEQERKQKEEDDRKAAEWKAAREAKVKSRMDYLYGLGLVFDFSDDHFKGFDCFVPMLDIKCHNDEQWDKFKEEVEPHIARKKEEAERKRLAEIEAQKEVARKNELRKSRLSILSQYDRMWGQGDIADPSDEAWSEFVDEAKSDYEKKQKEKWEKEQEEKRKQDELIRLQKLDAAKDKEKWEEMMQKINEVVVYEMRFSQYRKKAMILREKLEEIKAL